MSRDERNTETERLDALTSAIYHAARRPRRPMITQVSSFNHKHPERLTLRSIVIPAPNNAIGWSRARKLALHGKLINDEKYLASYKNAAEVRIAGRKARKKLKVEKYHRDNRGEWWMNHFADAVERRRNAEPTKGRILADTLEEAIEQLPSNGQETAP